MYKLHALTVEQTSCNKRKDEKEKIFVCMSCCYQRIPKHCLYDYETCNLDRHISQGVNTRVFIVMLCYYYNSESFRYSVGRIFEKELTKYICYPCASRVHQYTYKLN